MPQDTKVREKWKDDKDEEIERRGGSTWAGSTTMGSSMRHVLASQYSIVLISNQSQATVWFRLLGYLTLRENSPVKRVRVAAPLWNFQKIVLFKEKKNDCIYNIDEHILILYYIIGIIIIYNILYNIMIYYLLYNTII